MPRNIVIAVLWFLIFVVSLVLAIIFGLVIAVVVIPLGVVAIAAHSLIRSVKKRAISAPQAARSTGTALMAGLMSTRADSRSLVKSLPCEHAIRGKGVLQTFKDGSLQFVAAEFGSAFNFPFVGIRPEQTSVWHLIGRRFKFFFNEALRRELIQKGGSLFLPWHNLRSAIVGDHDKEKSIIVAHTPPGEGLQYEEFFFSKANTPAGMVPPADSVAIVRDLGLPEPPPEARQEALRWRDKFNWHLALTFFWFKQISTVLIWVPLTAGFLIRYYSTGAPSWVFTFYWTFFLLIQFLLCSYLLTQWAACSRRTVA